MLFIVIGFIFLLIIIITIDGDYNTKQLNKDKEQWKKLFNEDYK